MMAETQAARLRGRLGPSHYFAFGFGSIVGSGWLIIVGGWLALAGPAGTALGFIVGGAVISLIAVCYAALTARLPDVGCEFLYVRRVFGGLPGFMTGWFMALYYVAVCVFEGVALAEVLRGVLPAAGSGDFPAGLLGTALIYGLNVAGINISGSFQWLANYAFLAAAMLVLVILAAHGTAANLQPGFVPGHAWSGVLGVAIISIFMLDGFQAIPHAIEERAPGTPLHAAARMIVLSVVAAACFYTFTALASAAVLPWRAVAGHGVATFRAAMSLPAGPWLVRLLTIAAAVSLLKTWNVVMISGARLLVAMARDGMMPPMLGRVWGRQGAPVAAISLVAGLTLLGLKLGRSAVDPIISMSSVLLGAVYLASCLALLRLQQADGMRGGALALARAGAAAALVVLAAAGRDLLLQGAAGLPVMSVLAVWSALGLVVWRLAAGRTPPSPHSTDSEQRTDMASPQHRPGMGRP